MADLAYTYREQGRWKEAEELGLRVMEVRRRVLGEEHPAHTFEHEQLGNHILPATSMERG